MSFQIDKSKLYQKLFESFKKSHTSTKVQNVQKLVNEVWRNYKLQAKSDKELDIIVSKRIEEELQAATKNKSNLLHFFSKATTTCKPAEKTQIIQPASNLKKQEEEKIKPGNESQQQCENNENADKQRAKPSQEAMKNKIALLEKNLNALYSTRDNMPSRAEVDKQIIKLREEIKTAKQDLTRKIQNAVAQKKHRDGMKRKLEDICHENPEIKKRLSLRDSVGRPNLESNQPSLLKTIADIALFGSAADDRRRTESIRSVKTLEELTQELRKTGFDISRRGTLFREHRIHTWTRSSIFHISR